MLTKNVNDAAKKKDRLGCCLIESAQTGKRFQTSICLVQYWLNLKVNGTALKHTATKVRVNQSLSAVVSISCYWAADPGSKSIYVA